MKNSKIIIRPEEKDDLPVIYDFIKTAFLTAKVFDGNEQDFAVSLRESDNYIPQLALVAEVNGNIVGHIMLTKTEIIGQNGLRYDTLLLAPIAVKLEYRDQGIGSTLIDESLKRAKTLGYSNVFLVGDPNYYARFGFKSVSQFDIESSTGIPEPYVMGLELVAGSLDNKKGKLAAC